MKTVASILLTILAIPLFLIAVASASLRFQLLSPAFWEAAFAKNNVYSELSNVIKQSVVDQTVKEGGSGSSVKAITDLITVTNVKDFIDRNLENLLNYANGKLPDLMFYIPVGRAPKGFLPANFENFPESMPLTSLLQKLNITGITEAQIQYISLFGKGALLLFMLSAGLFALFFVFLFLLVERGSRFAAPGVTLILSGLALISLYQAGNQSELSVLANLFQKSSTAGALLGTVAPPLITEISRFWLYTGLASLFFGIILLFLKRGTIAR